MGRLRRWWQRLTGTPSAPPRGASAPVARMSRSPAPASELELADDDPSKPPSRIGAAGFDPYSSDAGYAKPHTWERVDRD